MNWGVIIGRFQTPYLHQGHLGLMDAVADRHENVIVLLGVRPATANINNPLSFQTRKAMVEDQYPHFVVLPVTDMREDGAWSKAVDAIVHSVISNGTATLYNGRDGFGDQYHGRFDVVTLTLPREQVSATDLRDHIDAQHTHPAFRAGVIHAVQEAGSIVQMCADMAVITPDGKSVIMGKKPGENLWRFPGGQFDPIEDETFEWCATREMREETGVLVELGMWNYVCTMNVKDWRAQDGYGIHTILYTAQLMWSERVEAGDDLAKAGTLVLTSGESMLVSEHRPLWAALLAHLEEVPVVQSL